MGKLDTEQWLQGEMGGDENLAPQNKAEYHKKRRNQTIKSWPLQGSVKDFNPHHKKKTNELHWVYKQIGITRTLQHDGKDLYIK